MSFLCSAASVPGTDKNAHPAATASWPPASPKSTRWETSPAVLPVPTTIPAAAEAATEAVVGCKRSIVGRWPTPFKVFLRSYLSNSCKIPYFRYRSAGSGHFERSDPAPLALALLLENAYLSRGGVRTKTWSRLEPRAVVSACYPRRRFCNSWDKPFIVLPAYSDHSTHFFAMFQS